MTDAVWSEAFILIPDGVHDLADFVAHPDQYLVSMYADPDRAAAIWHDRLTRRPYGSDGLLRLRYYGQDLVSADLWDEVSGIWYALVEVIEAFLQQGRAERLFPDQPVPIRMWVEHRSVLFSVHKQTTLVDPAVFIPGLLDEATRYFSWVESNIGTGQGDLLKRIEVAREVFHSTRYARHAGSTGVID